MGVFENQARDKSDWTDQDLLTYEEAEERLHAQERQLLADLTAATGDAAEELARRLAAVRSILERFRARQEAGS